MLRFISSLIIFFAICHPNFSQYSDKGFAEWLYKNKKYELAKQFIQSSDTLEFEPNELQYFSNKNNFQLKEYIKITTIPNLTSENPNLNSKRLVNGVGCFFNNDSSRCIELKKCAEDTIQNLYYQLVLLKTNNVNQLNNFSEKVTSQNTALQKLQSNINRSKKEYLKYQKIKPLNAALLSSIIPGLGKVYAKRPTEMIVPFLKTIVLGAITYEGYAKDQLNSIQFYVFGSLFIYNYSSNIYGSYTSAKNSKEDFQNHFKEQLSDYFIDITNTYIDK